jgi:diamine N-acetyltransferase
MSIFDLFFKKKRDFRISYGDCILKPLARKDLDILRSWFADRDLVRFAFGILAGDRQLDKTVEDFLKNLFSSSMEILGIWMPGPTLVGFVNYTIFKSKKKFGRIGILIGNEVMRSKYLGSKSLNAALFYLFDREGLEIVELDTASFNTRAQKCFRKCGFQRIGEMADVDPQGSEIVYKVLMRLDARDFFDDLYKRFDTLPIIEGKAPPSKHVG